MATKKLIEVALPLEKINAESIRERYSHSGHPFQLHMYWARRPLAAARAVIWSSLVDDPSSHPELFPTEEDQAKERERLFKILEDLVVWENSNDELVLSRAKAEIMKYTDGNPPALLDPFAGGGAIPLEAQRLGLEAHGHDLNPVAVMINKAMIEIPPKFAGVAPVNPEARSQQTAGETMTGAAGLAEDVRYYGQWMKERAFERIGHLYPKVKVPKEQGGGEATVIAWIWTRTVKCPNPACGCEMPLASSFVLSKKKGNEAWIELLVDNGKASFRVNNSTPPKMAQYGTKHINDKGKGKKATFCCPFCKTGIVDGDYADAQAAKGAMGVLPMAVVAEHERGRLYLSIDEIELNSTMNEVLSYYEAHSVDETVPHEKGRGTFASNAQGRYYGFFEFKDYFTKRQLVALTTFSDLVRETRAQVEVDAVSAEMPNDHIPFREGGIGAKAYSEAICVYLAFVIDKIADYNSTLCHWQPGGGKAANTFNRQAIPMVWDFAEANVFSTAYGGWDNKLAWTIDGISHIPAEKVSIAKQWDVQTDCGIRNVLVSTDPPYYDNVGYADLSDFFYVWMRKNLKDIYPDIFKTTLTPKSQELIATLYRHDGSAEKAKEFFESGMLSACRIIREYASEKYPISVFYAYKQNDTDRSAKSSSSGWETMLSAIILSGLSITGTWPVRTELSNRTISLETNSLASSIVLVCRKREPEAPICTRRNLIAELKRELRPALKKLQSGNIAPVDLAQSAIGPGMGVFSKYSKVLEADGSEMTVRSALQIINQELDIYFNEQDGELDRNSRFCVELYMQNAFNDMKFGEADTLARAKNTSVAALASAGVVYSQNGIVHLLGRDEIPEKVDEHESMIWLLTQQLTHAMEKDGVLGCARIVAPMIGSNADQAKDLAYRLFTIADKRGWAQEAYAYNALVTAWPDIQSRAAEIQTMKPEQLTIFD